ncbi:hypothetical protein WKT22_04770 [Candidatus Lokiarchaeum ossiferum]
MRIGIFSVGKFSLIIAFWIKFKKNVILICVCFPKIWISSVSFLHFLFKTILVEEFLGFNAFKKLKVLNRARKYHG